MKSKLLCAILALCLAQTSSAELPRGAPTSEAILVCVTGVLTAVDLLNKGLLFSEIKAEGQNVTSSQATTCAVAIGFETLVPVAAATTLAGIAFAGDRVEGVVHVATLLAFTGSTGGFVSTIIGLVNSGAIRWVSSIIIMSAVEAGALIASTAAIYRTRQNRARVNI